MLFRVAPSITAARARNLDEEKIRREEKAKHQDKFSLPEADTVPKISKHDTDGGLHKLYYDLSKIERVLEGLHAVKSKLGITAEDKLEIAKIDQGIEHLQFIQEKHKRNIKILTGRYM